MRPTLYVEDIFNGRCQENDTVELKGWVYNTRSSGKVKFLVFRDGTS